MTVDNIVENRCEYAADIKSLFQLVTNSIYKDKEIFLRELISNASDACEKLRHEANSGNITAPIDYSSFKILIQSDPKNKKMIIQDNGIGLNKDDMITNLGTIANSGTKKFLQEKLSNGKLDGSLIGQFGIGFYSAFLVAHEVIVESKKFGDDKGYLWKSTGMDGYSISEHDADFDHGTKIILNFKDEDIKYLDKFEIKHLIQTYSKNISYNIYFQDLESEDKKEELLNEDKALWMKDKNSITPEEYASFFAKNGGIYGSPWLTLHNHVEGQSNYTYLLFVPATKPFNMFDPDRKTSIKLHVNKVFITEDNDLLPRYLRFIKGIVDSYDLPLNVSREVVQKSYLITQMRQYLTKKIISELKKASEEKKDEYDVVFWPNFGAVLKEGLCEALNTEQRESIMEICRFHSSKSTDKMISLDEYISRMPENQKEIFYINGDNIEKIMRNPHLEGFIKRDIEVIFMTDGVDDFWTNVVLEYKDKKFKNISQDNINLNEIKEIKDEEVESKLKNEELEKLIQCFKDVLGKSIEDVVLSTKLGKSPACLGIKEGQMNMKMERFLLDQKQLGERSNKVLEINKNHELIVKMNDLYEKNGLNDDLKNAIKNLFDFVCIIEGEPLADSSDFSDRASKIINNIL